MSALQVLGHRDRGRHADGSLGAVLIAVEGALGAAQSVVFENHAQIGSAVVALPTRHERGVEARHADLYVEAMLTQIRRELRDRPLFLKADFGMLRDLVAESDQFGIHQLFGAGDNLVAGGIRAP